MGLFYFAAKLEYQREIFKLLADFFDVEKNRNFETFEKVFAKVQPGTLQTCNPSALLHNEVTQKQVLKIMNVYFEVR